VFNGEVRQWLLDNVNIIWFSFDGEPTIHDANRPCNDGSPSSPFLENNIKWLIENTENRQLIIGARVTVTNDTVKKQIQIVEYLSSLGIRYIWNDPLFPEVGEKPVCDDTDKLNSFEFDMDAYVDGYIKAFKYANERGVFYGSFLTCNFDGACDKHCRACTPTPHFTTDGYVSACDLVTFGENAHHMDCFVYGKWNETTQSFEFNEQKIQALKERRTINMTHCRSCDVKNQCGGYCLGEVMNESGSLLGQKPTTCKAIRRIAKEIGFPQNPYKYLHP